jgi:Domain of unknown function (DUF4326)
MTGPERIQLRRSIGWRKPEGAIVVARPSRWGNPYRIGEGLSRAEAVELYRQHLAGSPHLVAEARTVLRGYDLACWCPLSEPCHADVLLRLANDCQVRRQPAVAAPAILGPVSDEMPAQ